MDKVKIYGIGGTTAALRVSHAGRTLPATRIEFIADAHTGLLQAKITVLVDEIHLDQLEAKVEAEWVGGLGGFRRIWWRTIGRLRHLLNRAVA